MEIVPVYDRPILTLTGGPDVVPAMVRQRRRLLDLFASLTDEQWAAPSRCDGWRIQDVAAHLADVDRFWELSVAAGVSGTPTRYLVGFDPRSTPAAMVAAGGDRSADQTMTALQAATSSFCDLAERLSEADLAQVAEAPPGHVEVRDLLHHALWDAWIHERDVALPLGLVPAEEPDEIVASLRYVSGLSPVFAVMAGTASDATLVLEATDPAARVVVAVEGGQVRVGDGAAPDGAVVLQGAAVELTEGLSVRVPFAPAVPEDRAWLVRSLADVFAT